MNLRRFITLLCTLTLLITCCGCGVDTTVGIVDVAELELGSLTLETPNYNNRYDCYESFCATGDVCFYTTYLSSLSGIAAYRDGKRTNLVDDEELGDYSYFGDVFALRDRVYFNCYTMDDSVLFYAYDLKAQTYEHLLTVTDGVSDWAVIDGYLVYTRYYDEESGMYPLYCRNLQSGEEQLVCSEIEEFGIVNGHVRFVTFDGSYHLLDYDPAALTSEKLCTFTGYSSKEEVMYNFTEDRVILVPYETNSYRDRDEFTVCSVADGTTVTYTLPHRIYSFITGDKYAFAMCYSEETAASEKIISLDSYETTDVFYRIDPATGAYEQLPITANDISGIYVASDDVLYLFRFTLSLFNAYSTTVVRYDVTTQQEEMLFPY